MQERQTSQVAESLTNRIMVNNEYGSEDLTTWLVRKLRLNEGETILEVGCGTGIHLIEFARILSKPYSCTGIDISKENLERAKLSAKATYVEVKLIQGSMDEFNSLEVFYEWYHTVMFIYSLYYSNDPLKVLMNASFSLKEDGRLVVMGPYRDNNKAWLDFVTQFMPLPDKERKSTPTFMYDIVLKFAWTNFATISTHRFVNRIEIPNIEELRKYWKSTIYYKEQYDEAFEKHAAEYFSKNKIFSYDKVGMLVIMNHKIY